MADPLTKTKKVFLRSGKIVIANLWRVFLHRLNPFFFCIFANLASAIRGKVVRFQYYPDGKYSATSESWVRFFYDKILNYDAYEKGVRERGRSLGETYLLDYITFSDDDIAIDIGANISDLSLYFADLGVSVDYRAFEPSPREFECLSLNVDFGVIHNVGLWKSNSLLTFYIESSTGDSSFIEPSSFSEIITVPAVKLDQFFGEERIKLLKLEAEGAEPEVLMGFEKTLRRCEYVAADLGHERGQLEESTFPDVTNFLLGRGFRLEKVGSSRLTALFRNIQYFEN